MNSLVFFVTTSFVWNMTTINCITYSTPALIYWHPPTRKIGRVNLPVFCMITFNSRSEWMICSRSGLCATSDSSADKYRSVFVFSLKNPWKTSFPSSARVIIMFNESRKWFDSLLMSSDENWARSTASTTTSFQRSVKERMIELIAAFYRPLSMFRWTRQARFRERSSRTAVWLSGAVHPEGDSVPQILGQRSVVLRSLESASSERSSPTTVEDHGCGPKSVKRPWTNRCRLSLEIF